MLHFLLLALAFLLLSDCKLISICVAVLCFCLACSQVSVIPNAVDTTKFTPNPSAAPHPTPRCCDAGTCRRDVVAADADSVTVNYSCPGTGRGRTTIRIETPRLVQIDSQGLDHGMPFALRAEARRVGPCA